MHRLRETHDIVHVLTGFGTDGPGELGQQAFNLAKNRSPLVAMLNFGGMLTVPSFPPASSPSPAA